MRLQEGDKPMGVRSQFPTYAFPNLPEDPEVGAIIVVTNCSVSSFGGRIANPGTNTVLGVWLGNEGNEYWTCCGM
jgi:hypothetical protein